MLHRIKSLINLRRPYLEELILFIQIRPVLSIIANLFIIPGIYTVRFVNHYLKPDPLITPEDLLLEDTLPEDILPIPQIAEDTKQCELPIAREIPEKPDILLIVEATIPHCFRYRVNQKIEQLQSMNLNVKWVAWDKEEEASQDIHFAHIIIFYRVPGFDSVLKLIDKAHALNKVVLYDTDDLVFDKKIIKQNLKSFSGLEEREQVALVEGAELYYKAITSCSFSIGSTPTLCQQLNKITTSFLHRNALDKEILDFVKIKQQTKLKRNYISIFYGSGSKTHNHDFELIKSPLLRILKNYKQVRLTIIGFLELSEEFNPYLDRIDRMGFLSSEAYWQVLQYADINVAPLQPSIFADSKSEIKWIEAAIMQIPSVVSPTQTYKEIIENGKTAFLAETEDDWYECLSTLISDQSLRQEIAQKANQYVMENYHPDQLSANLSDIFSSVISENPDKHIKPKQKKKLVFVNVCFPPDGIGGATAIVINQINGLLRKYGEEFSISVFTIDFQNSLTAYQLREYIYNEVHVTAISVPPGIDIDWRYNDQTVYKLFKRYLRFLQADIIHFHSIQRLTASIMDAAAELKIPHLVTLHDSWWLCDRQFMINSQKVDCEQTQVDPIICSECVGNNDNSILRRQYLFEKLRNADLLLGVSDYQCHLYHENDFNSVKLHRNGIITNTPEPSTSNNTAFISEDISSDKLKLAYIGGVCIQKGYYFLKPIIKSLDLNKCSLTIVDFSLAPGETKQIEWGSNIVNIIAKIDFDQMPFFYRQIDVLLIPSMWRESFGLISREAIIQGAWVVAADAGGLAEDIVSGVNGDIFEKSNSEQLKDILIKINNCPDNYKNTVKKNTERSITSIEQNVDELAAFYHSLLSGQKTRLPQ